MLIKTKIDNEFVDGIRCDRCGSEHYDKFTYYSIDCCKVQVSNNIIPQQSENLKPDIDFDICDQCLAHFKNQIIKHSRYLRLGIVCDLCGIKMAGTYIYYFARVAKVIVHAGNDNIVDHHFSELNLCVSEVESLKAKKTSRG